MTESNILNLGCPAFPVWDELPRMGFTASKEGFSDLGTPMFFDFGTVQLAAACCLNDQFDEVVLFSGTFNSGNEFGSFEFQFPRLVATREAFLALLGENISRCFGTVPLRVRPDWLRECILNRELLPKRRVLKAYQNRPCCLVEREWLKLALKRLRVLLEGLEDDALVTVTFDGEALRFKGGSESIIVGATGKAWEESAIVEARHLRGLPSRLQRDQVWIDVWQFHLGIDRLKYPTVHQRCIPF